MVFFLTLLVYSMYPLTDNDKHGSMEPPSTSQHDQCACFAGLAFLQYPTAILAMLVCRHLISYYYCTSHDSTSPQQGLTRVSQARGMHARWSSNVSVHLPSSSSQFPDPLAGHGLPQFPFTSSQHCRIPHHHLGQSGRQARPCNFTLQVWTKALD